MAELALAQLMKELREIVSDHEDGDLDQQAEGFNRIRQVFEGYDVGAEAIENG